MKYSTAVPAAVRALIREGELTGPTTGYCDGYAQGNLVVLPKALAWDFLLFCQRNPKACPLLEVADAGRAAFPGLRRAAISPAIFRSTASTKTVYWQRKRPMLCAILKNGRILSAS